jgi:hypothetical protein
MKNVYIRDPIIQNACWVSYEPVAVTSTLQGTSFSALSNNAPEDQQAEAWESDRLPALPILIVLKLVQRIEFDFILIRSKESKGIKRAHFFVADDLDGADKGAISKMDFFAAGLVD